MKVIHRLLFVLACCFAIAALTSCDVLSSALTGRPVDAVEVRRTDDPAAPAVRIAATDLLRAERGDPATVHGLYDAGWAAEKAREVIATK